VSRERGLEFLERERPLIEAALVRMLDWSLCAIDPRIAETIRYAVMGGGKRLRPILCVAAYRAAGGVACDAVHDAASAIEILHTYSLVHDDLPCMDDDDLRRGRPTAHRVYGEIRATIAGAAMIPVACQVLGRGAAALGLADADRAAAILELARAAGAGGMIAGQFLDLEAESRPTSLVELEAIHLRKTGALFGASLRLGGRLARAGGPAIDALGECGRQLGLAFQVTDDLLDVTGQASVLGKGAGRDQSHGKATYPALLGINGARQHAARASIAAADALRAAGLQDERLEALIDFAVQRDR
jgi:geranylgeranyl diphosphate synthase type II